MNTFTWDKLYGNSIPGVMKLHREGKTVPPLELRAARNKLNDLYHARRDDELVERTRAEYRGRMLNSLTLILSILLPAFLVAAWFAKGQPSVGSGLIIPLAGGLGAAVAGTFKARDRLNREKAIKSFAQVLLAQLLLGAVAAVFVYVMLKAFPITISGIAFDVDTLAEKAAVGFVAGFSEPVFLNTIERITKLTRGDDSATKDGQAAQAADQAQPGSAADEQ